MANKPLTIDVNSAAIQSGSLDNWTPLGNTSVFIKNIITPQLSKKTNVGQLVSGIPTAFARVDLFKTALDHVATNGSTTDTSNLIGYYSQLVSEWKGLIACMALDYAHISVRRINLDYSDGRPAASTRNVYEPKGAFGNMLLKRRSRWCDQNLPANEPAVPYINVIKYRGRVVGATAPESLLFTSSGYVCEGTEETPWIDRATGRFIDPLDSTMRPVQVVGLHAYVSHILKGLDQAEQYYGDLPAGEGVDYTSIRQILSDWKERIADRAAADGYDLSLGSTPPVSASFGKPFEELFCHKDILTGVEGQISDGTMKGGVEFDPQELLLDDSARIARLDLNIRPDELVSLPILVLPATLKGMDEKAYFALPLSAQGLNVFGKNVAALVGMAGSNTAIKSKLEATYDPTARTGNLEVVLTLITDTGIRRQFKKIYTTDGAINNKDILIWPNFVSPQWNAYFMYNELPHNGTTQTYRAFPFVGQMEEKYFRIIVDGKHNPVLLSEDGKITVPEDIVKAELLVKSDEGVADNSYKYEIYRSDKPFKGVRLLSPTGAEGGFLLINYSAANGSSSLPHDWMRPGAHGTLQPVRLGVDFGSTNTSIAYSSDTTGERGFNFKSQRVSLMGNELPDHPVFPRENQVFFFQGAGTEVPSNAIKSVLTLHDNRRLPDLKPGETLKMRNEREVVGGFPSFAENLPFSGSDSKTITLSYPNGVGEVTQVHNMKWEDNEDDKAHKGAFLRTLMLQVYATLFAEGFVPESLKWSYPSAMAGQLLYSYDTIWQSLSNISPVLKENGEQYKLNVSKYIDTRTFGRNVGTGGFENGTSGFGVSGFGGDFGNTGGEFGGGFGKVNGGGFGALDNTGDGFGAGFGGGFGSPGTDFGSGFGDDYAPGFGDAPAGGTTDGDNTEDFMPDNAESPVVYNPKPLYDNESGTDNPTLSEAESVANFITARYAKETNMLNLCFDVGGSTTDISALFYLKDHVTMIKQNSLRFAAQRVSQAVSAFPEFRNVLTAMCAKYGIKMVGLNFGNNTYSEATAPYFFDQIVNRMNDDQLEDLYRCIAADCPMLMCVNMYVTGLLMYYAGQVAHKLVDDLNRVDETEWAARRKPNVRVTFAGKGSRLFQWLNTINPRAAHQYYGQLFVLGYGEKYLKETLAGWQVIELPKLHDPDIKYEVSKGLAKGDTDLQRPSTEQPSEIIGESGFELTGNDNKRRPIEFTNSISPAMMKSIGIRLCADSSVAQAQKFTEFCAFFYQAAHQLFGWNVSPAELQKACADMNITAYVQNMPEFRSAEREASKGNNFNFVAPVIILEGMKFYDTTLLRLLK